MVIRELLIQWNNPTYLMLLKIIMKQLFLKTNKELICKLNNVINCICRIIRHMSIMIILCIILVNTLYGYLLWNNCI